MKMQCGPEVLFRALEEIYKVVRQVSYGSRRDQVPYALGQVTAIAQTALKKAAGDDYPFCPKALDFKPDDLDDGEQ